MAIHVYHFIPERILNNSSPHHSRCAGGGDEDNRASCRTKIAGILLEARHDRHLPEGCGAVIIHLCRHEGTQHAGDPGLYFHEFLLFLSRISWECYPKEMEKKNVRDVIFRYFNYIFIRKNDDLAKGTPLPNLNRKMITKMKDFYKCMESEQEEHEQHKKQVKNEESAIATLTKRIKNEVINSSELGLDFG